MLDVDASCGSTPRTAEGARRPLYDSLEVHTEAREVFLDSFDDPLAAPPRS